MTNKINKPIVKVEGERDLKKEFYKKFGLTENISDGVVYADVNKVWAWIESHHSHLLSTLGRIVREEVIGEDEVVRQTYDGGVFVNDSQYTRSNINITQLKQSISIKNHLKEDQRQALTALLSSMEEVKSLEEKK